MNRPQYFIFIDIIQQCMVIQSHKYNTMEKTYKDSIFLVYTQYNISLLCVYIQERITFVCVCVCVYEKHPLT